MTAKTHNLFSFATLITASVYFPPASLTIPTTFTCIIGSAIGALIPDLDQATNRLWDLLPAGNFVGKIFRNLLLEHRTLSHSLLGLFLFYKLLVFAIPHLLNPAFIDSQLVTYSVMIGLLSHLVADMLTREGVPLLFPLPFKIGFPPFKFLRITTGKFVENFLVFPGIVVYIIWFIANQKSALLYLVKLIHS